MKSKITLIITLLVISLGFSQAELPQFVRDFKSFNKEVNSFVKSYRANIVQVDTGQFISFTDALILKLELLSNKIETKQFSSTDFTELKSIIEKFYIGFISNDIAISSGEPVWGIPYISPWELRKARKQYKTDRHYFRKLEREFYKIKFIDNQEKAETFRKIKKVVVVVLEPKGIEKDYTYYSNNLKDIFTRVNNL